MVMASLLMKYKIKSYHPPSKVIKLHVETTDTNIGNISWNEYLNKCAQPVRCLEDCTSLVHYSLVNAVVHPISIQLTKLINTLASNYVPDKCMVKNSVGEVVLDLRPDNIEDVFHLPKGVDKFFNFNVNKEMEFYNKDIQRAHKIVNNEYLMQPFPKNRLDRIDIRISYMKEDI